MSTYRKIHGRSIQAVTTDPTGDITEGQVWYNTSSDTFKTVLVNEAWSSAAPMINNHDSGMGSGEKDSALIGAGASGSSGTSAVEQYNGSGWATSPSLPGNAQAGAGTGPETAALWTQGTTFPIPGPGAAPASTASYEYNGSSWTSGGAQGTGKIMGGMSGTETAALAFGGRTTLPGGGPVTNTSEEYNGSSFSEGNNLNNGRSKIGFSGTQTAALGFGGDISNTASGTAATEEYDGTSWTSSGNLNTSRRYIQGFGIQTSSLAFGGQNNATLTEQYDGSTWTVKSTMGSGFATTQSSVSPSASTGIAAGGYTAPFGATTNIAEEWNASANVITAAAWANASNFPDSRRAGFSAGTKDASFYAGGRTTAPVTSSAEWDGSSWSSGPTFNESKFLGGCSGTYTAAIASGGNGPGGAELATSQTWNGSSWTAAPSVPTGNQGNCHFGTSTASVTAGGSNDYDYSAEWNGSSWTAGNNMNVDRYGSAGSGTLTAGLIAGGEPGPAASGTSENYDGTNWTTGATLAQGKMAMYGGSSIASAGTSGSLISGGYKFPSPAITTNCQAYNGTSWATTASISTGRYANQVGSNTSALFSAGYNGSSNVNNTEEFTGETSSINVKTLTQS